MTRWLLTLIGCCFTTTQAQTEDGSVQLYLYLNPSPKWGYIAEDSNTRTDVQFYECNVAKPILVDRSKLKEADGLCRNHRPDARNGTWIVRYDPQRKVFVAVDSDDEAPVSFTKEELFGNANTSPEFAHKAFGVAIEGKSKKVFPVEGKVRR